MKACIADGCEQPKIPGQGRRYCDVHREEARAKRRKDAIARTRRWRKSNPERWRMLVRANRYGMTADEYGDLIDFQQGCCAICGVFGGLNLDIDHDHETGQVRGLLCSPCNQLLGGARDRIWILESAVSYLAHPRVKQLREQLR